jgi:hypothetical protein
VVDGELIGVADPSNDPMLFSVATATVWTDTNVTLTHPSRMGASTLEMKREVLEPVITFCRPGQSVSIMISDQEFLNDWKRAAAQQ